MKITFPDNTSSEYRYDALGRRIEKDAGGTVARYVYGREDILLEYACPPAGCGGTARVDRVLTGRRPVNVFLLRDK